MAGIARNAWLDSLRAFAILAVVVCHICSGFREVQPQIEGGSQIEGGLGAVAGIGGHGVDLFFVLSGWLLGCLLLKEKNETGSIDAKRFWIRRWFRTLPAYYVVLLLTFSQRVIQERWQIEDAWYLVFAQNYVFESLPFLGISWSLCIEEQFYLLIAPLLLLLPTRSAITIALGLMILIPGIGRWIVADANPWMTHLRIDGCAYGVLLAHVFLNYPEIWKRLEHVSPWGILIGVGWLSVVIVNRYLGEGGDLPLFVYVLVSGFLVVLSQTTDFWKERATHPILQYFASRSYSLYLVHIEGLAIARRFYDGSFVVFSLIAVVSSLLIAELLFRAVEKPWMRFRDRKIAGRSSQFTSHDGRTEHLTSSIS